MKIAPVGDGMNRRSVLGLMATVGSLTAVSGCLGGDDDPTERTDTDDESGDDGDDDEDGGDDEDDGTDALSLDDYSFDADAPDCETGDTDDGTQAEIIVEDAEVTVGGFVTVPDLCEGAALGEVDVDDGKLILTVTTEVIAESCVQCLGTAGYTATFTLTGAPGAVEVVHDGRDGQRTVATWSP